MLDTHLINSRNQPLRNCGQNKMEKIVTLTADSSLNEIQRLWLCLFFGICNFYNNFVIGLRVVQFCL